MAAMKVSVYPRKSNSDPGKLASYDHYIAVDWSQKTMAIARLKPRWERPIVVEQPADLSALRSMLTDLHGRRILTIEESSQAHWLYVELHDAVEQILICDPTRNRLLNQGPKTDKIDAAKLCTLLRGELLQPVYHSLEATYRLRQLVSAYEDVIGAGVRLRNQDSAFQRSVMNHHDALFAFIGAQRQTAIAQYVESKKAFIKKFVQVVREDERVRRLAEVEGIGQIGAVKIVATVVDARRFPSGGHYLSYSGLVKHEKWSGGRRYGRRKGRYSRRLKSVYKTAAAVAIQRDTVWRAAYERMCGAGMAAHNARHAVARRIARITYGMMKNGTAYRAPKEDRPTT